MKRVLFSALPVLLLVIAPIFTPITGLAQDKDKPVASVATTAPAPVPAAKPVPMNLESQNAILKAEHELDLVQKDMMDVAQQFQNLQKQADSLNPRFKADQEKQTKAQAAVDAALEAAYKANGVSKDQYNADPANFTFVLKPPVAPAKADAPPAKPAPTTAANTPAK